MEKLRRKSRAASVGTAIAIEAEAHILMPSIGMHGRSVDGRGRATGGRAEGC